MLKVEAAKKIVLKNVNMMTSETTDLNAALGRVLAMDVRSSVFLPPFDNSAMDGYAVRVADTKGAANNSPCVCDVIEDIPAGKVPRKKLGKGQAARIMTGALVPQGAEGVVIVEVTEAFDKKVKIYREAQKNDNIRRRGEDVRKGQIVLERGTVLRPQEIGMLAALNIGSVRAARRPRVAIISSGDELVKLGGKLKPGKIRDVNSHSLHALVLKYGGVPVDLGIARDNRRSVVKRITSAIKGKKACDIVVLSAGVSVGDYDLVKDVLVGMGLKTIFWRVAMKPGKPLLFGKLGGKPLFGLPGNPVSSMVSFELFVGPAIKYMQGGRVEETVFRAVLDGPLKNRAGRRFFARGSVRYVNSEYRVTPCDLQGSGMLMSMVKANCLIVVPEDVEKLGPGEKVDVRLLDAG